MVRTSYTSTITFRSDVPPTKIPQTGVIHGVRFIDDGNIESREQHVYCWVRSATHIEKVGEYMLKRKFHKDSLVFVPYSTRDNWMRRYPHAVPTLECTKEGVVVERTTNTESNSGGNSNADPSIANNPQMNLAPDIPQVKSAAAASVLPIVSVTVEKRQRREFDDYLRLLVKFREEHGHVDVPNDYKQDPKLGKWVHMIRIKMRSLQSKGLNSELPTQSSLYGSAGGAKELTEQRIAQLDMLGFNWDTQGATTRLSWDDRFHELCEYYQVHGHWPPRSAGTIGEWAHKQKSKEVKKDKAFMEKYYAKLDAVGFPWRVKDLGPPDF